MTNEDLVAKVWNYAHVLREEGVSYGDYVEQITYLLFLKMDDERQKLLGEPSIIPPGSRWADLRGLSGEDLEIQRAGRHTVSRRPEQDREPGAADQARLTDRRRDLDGSRNGYERRNLRRAA